MLASPHLLALLAAGTVLGAAAPALASPQTPAGAPDAPPPPTSAPPPPASTPPWNSSQPAPPGYHVERRINRGLVIAGSVVFGVAYVGIVIPLLIVAANGSPSAAVVTVPVGGPFYLVPANLRGANGVPAVAGMAVLDALVQAAGAGMLIGGIAGKRVLVPGPSPQSTVQLAPVPLRFGNGGAGIGIAGAF
jgi:hypothetical protein